MSCSSKALQFGIEGSSALPIRRQLASNTISTTHVLGLSVETFLGEGSGPNKRAHVEDAPETPAQAVPTMTQFQAGARDRKKPSKKVGKRANPQPLVGMLDEKSGVYDRPVSIRQMLKDNKVELSWIELLALSPEVCREVKRLSTRVAKKRASKMKPGQTSNVLTNPASQFPFSQPGMPLFPGIFPPAQVVQPTFQLPLLSFPTQQPQVPGQTFTQPTQYTQTFQSSQPVVNQPEVLNTKAGDGHTKFLHQLQGIEKAF